MKDEEKLKNLYKQAAELDEDLPVELIKKMKIYGEILGITGRLHAAALSDWKLAEVYRKETIVKTFLVDKEGTVKDREMRAELAASMYRKAEAEAEGECMRWKNAYNSTLETINILKIQFRDIKEVNQGGI